MKTEEEINRQELLTALALVLTLAGLPSMTGCRQPAAAPSLLARVGADTKQVTVAVTGMT